MDIIIFILIGALIGGATAFLINYCSKKDEDEDGVKKQKIFDSIKKLKEDIESTV
mgnify:CR=1 FL=1